MFSAEQRRSASGRDNPSKTVIESSWHLAKKARVLLEEVDSSPSTAIMVTPRVWKERRSVEQEEEDFTIEASITTNRSFVEVGDVCFDFALKAIGNNL